MKTSTGILSFEIYNQEGKNELYLSKDANFTQLLKLNIRNGSPYHQAIFETNATPHLTLKLKKGLLPSDFSAENIKIKKYRLIKGSDLFSQAALEGFLFDKSRMEQQENFQMDIQRILDAIDDGQASRSVTTDDLKIIGVQDLLTHFQQLSPQEKSSSDYKWIADIQSVYEEYKTVLAELDKIADDNPVISSNPLFSDIIKQVAGVFEKLSDLQNKTLQIEKGLNLMAQKVEHQQKTDFKTLEANFQKQYQDATLHLVNAIKDNLKVILVEALAGIKIKDITNLDQLKINEDILRKLEEKAFIQDDVKNREWGISFDSTAEEQLIHFTCKKEISILPNEYLLIDFDLVGALGGTASNAVTELSYNNLSFQKNGQVDTSVTSKVSQAILNVVNFGTMGIPPQMDVKVNKGYNVINNGTYENEVILDLINTSDASIYFNSFSQVQLSFYKQQEAENIEYALMDKDGSLSSVSLLYDAQDKTSLIQSLDSTMLVKLIQPFIELSDDENKRLLKKLPKSTLLNAVDLKSIINKEGAKSQALNDDILVKTIFDMIQGSNRDGFRLDKDHFLYCQKYTAPNSFKGVNVFELVDQSGSSFYYNIYAFGAFEYDTTHSKLITPLADENLKRQIKVDAILNNDFQLVFKFNVTKIQKRALPIKRFNPNAASQSLTVTSGINFSNLLKENYFTTNTFFKGLIASTSKYKDYDYLYYKQYQISQKGNGKKAIVLADVMVVKKSGSTYQVFRPLPNDINGARDLETTPIDSSVKITDALQNASFVEEPMELLCTISIQDTTAEIHYSMQAIEDINQAIYTLVFNKKGEYTALNATLNGYISAYYLKATNINSTTTRNSVIAIAKDNQNENRYRLDYISAVNISNGQATPIPNAQTNTVYEVQIAEKVINGQNSLTRTYLNISKNTNLYGDRLYEPDSSKFVSAPFPSAIETLIPNYATLVKNNLNQIFQDEPNSAVFRLISASDIAAKVDNQAIFTALNVTSTDGKHIEYPLSKAQNATTIQTTYQTSSNLLALAPSQKYQLKISGLKTQLSEGESDLKVSLLNVPNYKDGHWKTNISRVSFISEGDKGIFTKGPNNDNILITQKNVQIKSETFSIQSSIYDIMPVGAIIMWYGDESKIPGGWRICNGTNGTPDLRDKFIVGAGNTYNLKDTGGQKEVTLTSDQMPAHTHTMESNGSHSHSVYTGVSDMGNSYDYDSSGRHPAHWDGGTHQTTENSGDHKHTINSTGGNKAHENRPPYYALYYIMRVAVDTFRIYVDEPFKSGNGHYTLLLQKDGNIVIYKDNYTWKNGSYRGNAPWSSSTYGKSGFDYLAFKAGDLVACDNSGNIKWRLSQKGGYTPNTKATQLMWKGNHLIIADSSGNQLHTVW